MTEKQAELSLDSFVEEFDLAALDEEPKENCYPLTLWIPMPSKEKYDELQRLSKKKFGKFLKKVVNKSIDRVKLPEKKSS